MSFVSNFTDPKTMNNDKIINRDELQQNMIDTIVDGMDMEMYVHLHVMHSKQLMMNIRSMN